ncbi:hypothetical protein [Neisseria chenwenguii]|nr:hypothetical protein [Neisseria chenwenguii]
MTGNQTGFGCALPSEKSSRLKLFSVRSQFVQSVEIACDQGFLFLSAPAPNLFLAFIRIINPREHFDKYQPDGLVFARVVGAQSVLMLPKTEFDIFRAVCVIASILAKLGCKRNLA